MIWNAIVQGGWRPWIEILVLWLIFYAVLFSLRGTRFSGVLKGVFFGLVLFILALQILARVLQLEQLGLMINLLLGGLAFAILIMFGDDMRRALTGFAQAPLLHAILRRPGARTFEPIVDAVMRMAQNRVGALIVLEREIGMRDIVERGVRLDAEVTAPLLESIFHPGGVLHDGAVVVRGNRVVAAACFLPLTDDPDVARTLGTRHRAAMGITEETDAAAIVISEETGQVSLCTHGRMTRDLDRQGLVEKLNALVRPTTQRREVGPPAAGESVRAPGEERE
jgi:diadenylate cyclase